MAVKKNINFIIRMDVYPFDIMVSIAQTDNQLGSVLDKYPLTQQDIRSCQYSRPTSPACAALFSTNASIIRMRKLPRTPEDYGSLAHEVFHVVSFIMDRVGMKLKIMVSDEAYAYLIGFVTKSIYQELNKYY